MGSSQAEAVVAAALSPVVKHRGHGDAGVGCEDYTGRDENYLHI